MVDDIAWLHSQLLSIVDNARNVILVLHSAGGFLGSNAMKGLTSKDREAQRKKGGVRCIVFLAGGVIPEGVQHGPVPFMDFQVMQRHLILCGILILKNRAIVCFAESQETCSLTTCRTKKRPSGKASFPASHLLDGTVQSPMVAGKTFRLTTSYAKTMQFCLHHSSCNLQTLQAALLLLLKVGTW